MLTLRGVAVYTRRGCWTLERLQGWWMGARVCRSPGGEEGGKAELEEHGGGGSSGAVGSSRGAPCGGVSVPVGRGDPAPPVVWISSARFILPGSAHSIMIQPSVYILSQRNRSRAFYSQA